MIITDQDGLGGLRALAAVAKYHNCSIDAKNLAHQIGYSGEQLEPSELIAIAKRIGLHGMICDKVAIKKLLSLPTPAIVQAKSGEFLIMASARMDRILLIDPSANMVISLTPTDYYDKCRNIVLLFRLDDSDHGPLHATSSIPWMRALLIQYAAPLSLILLTTLFLQVTGLAPPLLLQIIIDKVLTHNDNSTLIVVTTALVVAAIIEASLFNLRAYLLGITSSKLDVELGVGVFKHMISLPVSYFETRAAGVTVSRVRELENIRTFLTGTGTTSIVDGLFAVVYIVVLFLYSNKLAIVTSLSIPVFFVIGVVIRPPLRDLIKRKFQAGAQAQQHLVETVLSALTIKALAAEPLAQRRWDRKFVDYVKAALNATILSSAGQSAIQLTSKLFSAIIIFIGAGEVIHQRMTVGALVAFNMIASQMLAPVVRLSGVMQDFQQVQVSLDRLNDILEHIPEYEPTSAAIPPPLKGDISFSGVIFRYTSASPEVLKGLSFAIDSGEIVGIIGPSGSGKSTISKLLQRLYIPEQGQVLIDGVDLAQASMHWFRQQIGVVLQDTMLLNRSIHENIALANPSATRELVIQMSMLSGAHEFISALPRGYDTVIEERGTNLSGGQRQRIAIARSLVMNPRILIFDEATSALDYESERAIQDNMRDICNGRTVLIIAHRFAALRNCSRIIGVRDGVVVEDGSPEVLRHRTNGLYYNLLRAQELST